MEERESWEDEFGEYWLDKKIKCGGSPIDLNFMNDLIPKLPPKEYIIGNFIWDGDKVIFVPNDNGKIRLYYDE